MTDDRHVTSYLVEVLEDGRKGFASAAEKLADSDRPDLAPTFARWGERRAQFKEELQALAAAYGDDIDGSGSAEAALHRGWMALKDLVAGSDPDGVLEAAVQGEEHAVEEYQKALGHDDLSPELRLVIERQFAEVSEVQAEVRALTSAA